MPNFTPIPTGAPENASVVNAPLYQLDSAITTLNTLPAAVAALQAAMGNMATAGTTSHIVVGAINEINAILSSANIYIAALQTSVGNMASTTTNSHVVAGAITELKAYIDSLFIIVASIGGSTTADNLREWTEDEAYQMISVTYHPLYVNTVSTAIVVWPDGSLGNFTATSINPTWEAIDAYTISHLSDGLTVTQAAVTRNANGNVTAKPLLTAH